MKFDLGPQQLDQIERFLLPRLHAEEARLLRPIRRERHIAIMQAIEQLPWHAAPMLAAEAAFEILIAVDPVDDEADVPWGSALKLAETPRIGSRLARRWFAHLLRLRTDDHEVSVVMEGVAAYGVAAYEELLGRPHEVSRWLLTASIMTEDDERTWLSAVVVVRAARLYAPLLRRWPSTKGRS